MNLYQFSLNYLKTQTLRYFPTCNINDLEKYYDCNLYAWSPFFETRRGKETLNDLMKMFAMILQNYFNLPNIIKFRFGNFEVLSQITNNFNVNYLLTKNKDDLLIDLGSVVGTKSRKTWDKYCTGLIDAANYLSNYRDFNDYINHIRTTNSTVVINELCRIKGIGKALSRNYLKEIGFFNYGKPDTHTLKVYKSFDSSVTDENTWEISHNHQCSICGVTPYKLDRIIWLICSGDYFMDNNMKINIKKGVLRNNFINELTLGISNGTVII